MPAPTRAARRCPLPPRRSSILACVVAACLGLAAVSPARAQVGVLDAQRSAREQQYKNYEQMVERMPRLEVKSLDDVLKLRVERGHLVCTSPLADPGDNRTGQFRVELPSMPGPTYVQASTTFRAARINAGAAAAGAAPVPQRMVSLVNHRMPTPDGLVTLNVQSYPGWVQVTRTSAAGNRTRRVQLHDQAPAPGVEGTVRLTVTEYGVGVTEPTNLSVQVADFAALVRGHRPAVEEFVRPLLREVGQEAALAPDPLVAWQVFSHLWRADERVTAEIRKLLPGLAAEHYKARERAATALADLGPAGAAALLRLDRTGLTPEQNLLIDRVLAPYSQLDDAEAARLRGDADFLLDCLYTPDAAVRDAALARLREVTGKALPFDPTADGPARAAAVDVLRAAVKAQPATRPVPATAPTR